jgi:hypothetical protein
MFLSNDHKTKETTDVARQQPTHNNGSTVGSDVFYVVCSKAISLGQPSSVQLS